MSAVEDQLQDDISQTFTALRQAGINLWMLTGDKTLTAVNIAKASGLTSKQSTVLEFTRDTLAAELSSIAA